MGDTEAVLSQSRGIGFLTGYETKVDTNFVTYVTS